MEKISVIVPYYDSSLFLLRRCIDSILKQSYQNLEILVVVDGSHKDYFNLNKEMENRDKRIHFIYQKHKGVSAARNIGIEKSTGKYLSFIDSDDYIDSCFYFKLLENIRDCDLAICGIAEQYFPTISGNIDRRVFFSLPTEFCNLQYINPELFMKV